MYPHAPNMARNGNSNFALWDFNQVRAFVFIHTFSYRHVKYILDKELNFFVLFHTKFDLSICEGRISVLELCFSLYAGRNSSHALIVLLRLRIPLPRNTQSCGGFVKRGWGVDQVTSQSRCVLEHLVNWIMAQEIVGQYTTAIYYIKRRGSVSR